MKLKHLQLAIAAQLVCMVASQNARSYDTNDWIPVTQKSEGGEATQKKATGRVLNLDTPSQKFFPDEFIYKKGRPNFQSRPKHKDRYNVPKYENTYKFELPPTLPQAGAPKFQYYPKQEIQLPNYQQPPPLEIYRPPPPPQYVQNPQTVVQDRFPPPNTYGQYTIPINNTNYYQTLNPISINQELLGNIQFQNINGAAPVQDNKVFYQSSGQAIGIQDNKLLYQNTNGVIGVQGNQNFYQNTNGGVQNKQLLAVAENSGVTTEKVDGGKDAVQLVYVPLENLKDGQPIPQDSQTIYRQIESPTYENPIDKQHRLAVIEQDFIQQALQATKLQEQIQQGDQLLFQISTTPKPVKKRKPHQPPLAVYVEGETQQVEISDVLEALKDAKSIAVQDSIQPDSPQIFIGPSTLEAPDYSKFPLPYLNGLDGNRLNRNVESLPFFVAPLSFKAPPGFSKIPLPAPHVGSVVISNKEELYEKRSTPQPNQLNDISIKQVSQDVPVTTPKPAFDILTPQPYLGQTYYNPGSFGSSPRPQLLQFDVNDRSKDYTLPSSYYNQQILNNEYNKPSNSQTDSTERDVASNSNKNPENPAFQYSYIDEIATRTTPKSNLNTYNQLKISEDVKYNAPSRTVTYSPQDIYEQEERIKPSLPTYQQQYTDDRNIQKQTEATVQYEPIATTFDSSPRPQEEHIVNIKPKAESGNPKLQKVNNYANEKQQKSRLPDVNPLELAINEFELHQINTQLEEKPRVKNQNNYKYNPSQDSEDNEYKFDPELHRFSSTPATILRDSYIETTVRPTTKPRNRIRTRPSTTTTTTTTPPDEERYTVLEDFYAREKPTSQYSKPSNVHYELQTEDIIQTEPAPTKKKLFGPKYPSSAVTEIENIPTNVYNLKLKQNVYTEAPPKEHTYTLNQNLMDQQILHSDIRQSNPQYEQQGQFEVDPHSHQYTIPSSHDSTREHIDQYYQQISEDNEKQAEYTNPLEDPSVRSLLSPNLLVPTTTNNIYTGPSYLPTTEKLLASTTTEIPIETTTHGRVRSRARGGSKYSETSTTKRPISRRKPTQYSRVTTTERTIRYNTPQAEHSTRSTNTKQRFRTRGRTTPNSLIERLSTTEHETHAGPSSETNLNIRTHPDGSESYIQYEQTVDRKTEEPIVNEEYPTRHVTSIRPVIQYENTASTSKPVLNVQVTHPATYHQRFEDEETPKVKVRGRIRDRPRVSSTTTEKAVTRRVTSVKPVQKEESGEEFYGFFRQPNFGAPTETRIEVTTTPAPTRFIYQTPSQHREDHQSPINNVNIDTSTVRFVGEIVPKYTTSREVQTETETPKPRTRGRIRTTQRRPVSNHQEHLEQNTRRNTVIRSRGKTHYRLPENLKKNKDEEADVEGGNYPQQFLSRKGVTTPTPEFQITVAPEEAEDDQSPYSSIYRPNVVASPEEWHDASISDHVSKDKSQGNVIDKQEEEEEADPQKNIEEHPISPDQPYALPVKSSSDETSTSTDSSEEKFRKTTQQIEEQFEAINNFDGVEKQEEKKKGRRKGVWKLVKHRPVDHLQTSESQNYFSVLNSFHDIQKVKDQTDLDNRQETIVPYSDYIVGVTEQERKTESYTSDVNDKESVTEEANVETTLKDFEGELPSDTLEDKSSATTLSSGVNTQNPKKDEEDFLDSIYEMFGMSRNTQMQEEASTSVTEADNESTATTTQNPTFPEELTDAPVSSSSTVNVTERSVDTTTLEDFFTTLQLDEEEKRQEIKTGTFEVEPWDMKKVRTSTSTEVSHETEICYRGRCVRSPDRKKRF